MELSVILVTYNSSATIEETLDSAIKQLSRIDHEIIVLDNNSSDRTIELLGRWRERIRLIRLPENVGFASANNIGVAQAVGEVVLLLNPDVCLSERTKIGSLIEVVRRDETIGLVAPRLRYADGSVQESARQWPSPAVQIIRGCGMEKIFGQFRWYRERSICECESDVPCEVDWVLGAFMLLKRSTYATVEGFDEGFFLYYEDIDLCVRLHRLSLRVLYVPWAEAIHHYKRESARSLFSRTRFIHMQSILRFYRKYGMTPL